jgi:DNA-binding MarR family transcriptional regulator
VPDFVASDEYPRRSLITTGFRPNTMSTEPKYVNMADINAPARAASNTAVAAEPASLPPEPTWDIIELLFFAYRDFVGDPDHVLEALRFGRAHHRVLHFVNRNPGMKVAELLDILRITKQSLGRVLKQLVDQGYVEQRAGPQDRRQRLLYVTGKGEALAMRLARLQTTRITRAFDELGAAGRDGARQFLAMMIDPQERERVLRLIGEARRARRAGD